MSHVTRMSIKYNNAAYLDWMLSNSSFEMEALARMALMSANSFSIFSKAAWKKTTSVFNRGWRKYGGDLLRWGK